MELAGQSVAIAVARQYAPIADKRVLVVAGPGSKHDFGVQERLLPSLITERRSSR